MPTPAERKALLFLAGVIVLGASVRVVRAARGGEHADPTTRAALARQLAAVDSAHRSEAEARGNRGRRGGATRRRSRPTAARDSSPSPATSSTSSTPLTAPLPSAPPTIVDLDVAAQGAIESLPRIGPVLARRIVEDRSANGPFGSLDGLQRVRGVGPALAGQLAGRVTFSGTARPSNTVVNPRLSTSSPTSKSRRRERRNQPEAR